MESTTKPSHETIAAKRMSKIASKKYRIMSRMTTDAPQTTINNGIDAPTTTKKTAMTSSEKSAMYRARKRMTAEGLEELREKSRISSQNYRRRKREEQKAGTTNTNKKKKAMTGAERQAAYRARKRATQAGAVELNEKGRVYNKKYRENKKFKTHLVKDLYKTHLVKDLYNNLLGQPSNDNGVKSLISALYTIEVKGLKKEKSKATLPAALEDTHLSK